MMNIPLGAFFVCRPLSCLMKMKAPPTPKMTAARMMEKTKPTAMKPIRKHKRPPPTGPAAQYMYRPCKPINSRGF